ncbi:MAG: sigma-70 family RNA polymerase sigma factor, partial [Chloroflexi bacterium]
AEHRARLSSEEWGLGYGDLSPEQVLHEEEARQQVWAALAALPDHYREALVLKYIEGLSVAEVAQVMDRSFKSVESILVRARRALADLLLQQDQEGGTA